MGMLIKKLQEKRSLEYFHFKDMCVLKNGKIRYIRNKGLNEIDYI